MNTKMNIVTQRCFQRPWAIALVIAGLLLTCLPPVAADEFDEKFEHWPIDLKIGGRIVLASDLADLSILKDALPTAARKGPGVLIVGETTAADVIDRYEKCFASFSEDQSKQHTVKLAGDFFEALRNAFQDARYLCWHADGPVDQKQWAEIQTLRPLFQRLLADGGTIIAVDHAASLISEFCLDDREPCPAIAAGLHLVPNGIVSTGYDDSAKMRGRLLSALALHPRSVGIGIERNTAVVLDGRQMHVVGEAGASFLLMANEHHPIRHQRITRRQSRGQLANDYLIDLTQWRRAAIDRTIDPFPPPQPDQPRVERGTLLIVGGGGMPEGLMDRFVQLAGGVENARLVYVPCSEQDRVSSDQRTVEFWKKMGVKHATFIHTKDRNRANSDEEFLAPLREATGIWFGGGRQWNFADSYYGTTAHKLMKAVLQRGGVIGGSSAGASIQADYLARATPINNFRIMAPGYERGGLGFIKGVAIDQHFSQRGRQKDMTQLVNRYPQLLGIGIDEATALIVTGSTAEIVGKGQVYFYDRKQPVYPDRPDYIALPAGATFDLVERTALDATSSH